MSWASCNEEGEISTWRSRSTDATSVTPAHKLGVVAEHVLGQSAQRRSAGDTDLLQQKSFMSVRGQTGSSRTYLVALLGRTPGHNRWTELVHAPLSSGGATGHK